MNGQPHHGATAPVHPPSAPEDPDDTQESGWNHPAAPLLPRPPRHPAIELLTRYAAVLRAAWSARAELAGPRRLADEAAFLPAALSLQTMPPHPAPRRAAWTLLAFAAAALSWACLGRLDIVAVAPGRIVAGGHSKLVQPLEAGVVRAIHVQDGQPVQAGQLLVELDPTTAQADDQAARQAWAAAVADSLRLQALLAAMGTVDATDGPRAPQLDATSADAAGLDAPALHAARTRLQADWAEHRAQSTRHDAEVRRATAEQATAHRQLQRLEAALPAARQRETDMLALARSGYATGHQAQDHTQQRVALEKELAAQQAREAEAAADLGAAQAARTAYRAQARRNLEDRLAEARRRRDQLLQESTKAARRRMLVHLTAPVRGTVQQLSAHTSGGVVTPAQVLMLIVPDEDGVTAEVQIENQDIGFVHTGQRAEVKLLAFPYTRYGTVPAALRMVSADAVPRDPRDAPGPPGPDRGPAAAAVFPATLRLERDRIDIDGRPVRLRPGMALHAEIRTGSRRVIDYLLSPLQAAIDNSLEER